MRRMAFRWFAPLLAIAFLGVQRAYAQPATPPTDDPPAPVFAFFIAISATILILFTLLKPTRRHL